MAELVGKVVNGVLQDANNAITSTKKDTKGTSCDLILSRKMCGQRPVF